MSLAVLASMILSANSSLFADEVAAPVQKETTQITLPPKEGGDLGAEVKAELSWYSYQHLVNLVTNNPKMSAGVGIAATVVAMCNYCSWFRRLVGLEDEDTKSPRLNSRLATAQRAY